MNNSKMKPKTNISNLFSEATQSNTYVKVCAPMVRYSKVQFRTLVKNYGVDLCFTPMILADSFCQNEKARSSEFATTFSDTPVVAQFAANNANDFVDAATLLYPYTDGVDLNCGCPQRWAMKDGYGCALLSKPDIVHSIVREVKNKIPENFSMSVKIRILKDLKKTIDMCQQLEKCGVDFLTVHGRTPTQKSGDSIDKPALREVCASVNVPVIANGGIKTLADSDELFEVVHCNGVMAASGILSNPALFSGATRTPLDCVLMWMDLKNQNRDKITFQCYHHHLVFMLEKILTKTQKPVFNLLNTFEAVDDFLYENLNIPDNLSYSCNLDEFVSCEFDEDVIMKHRGKCRGCGKSTYYCICVKYDYNTTDGNYFTSYVQDEDCDAYCNMFDEPT
ncbi:tRNA-dihydrouridine(20a/20b) synthase [NAD(P)+]-like [Cydia splendana]|uniref:tRNA-dihydrouridine(20a/20b) synthase [NAD(P)+]-like n=1 Tax=Cydia splendana TaxID=1100963 RepID=UPI00300D4EE3